MAISTGDSTFLDLIDICDNVHLHRDSRGIYDTACDDEILVPLYLDESSESAVIGLLRPVVVEQLRIENERSRQNGLSELWAFRLGESEYIESRNGSYGPRISFRDWLDVPSKRTAAMKELCERWRDTGIFTDACGPKQWRSEMYPVYADPFGVHDYPDTSGKEGNLNYAFEIERAACSLFGLVTYGVHMSIYDETVQTDGSKVIRVWVPRRALTKPTWPGYLDNTVAGGIPSGISIFESLVKECMEEASLGAEIVHQYAKAVVLSEDVLSWKGWPRPEVQYVYDMRVPPDVDPLLFTPRPMDGEVESFELVSQDKLLELLRSGLFKPNCALVIIDLLIRLGCITPDNEPNYMKIITRLHGNFDYEKW